MSAMRSLAVFIALLLLAVPATAQTTLGLKGGVGFAAVSIEEAGVEEESVARLVAGLELGVPVSGMFSLRVGGAYAQKGGRGVIGSDEITLNIDYIQLDAMARLAMSNDRGISFGVMAGPWIGFRLSCDVGVGGPGFNLSVPCDDSDFARFDIKTLDAGLAFGGGVEVPLAGSLRLGLDAIYSLGLAAVDEDDSRTRFLTLQAGVTHPIG